MTDTSEKQVLQERIAELRERLHEIREEETRAAHDKLIGKCFMYMNSYSGPSEEWPLYAMVERSDGHSLRGLEFQTDCDGKIEITADARLTVRVGGWREVPRMEFLEAWNGALERLHEIDDELQ